jgi:hypothetical protein
MAQGPINPTHMTQEPRSLQSQAAAYVQIKN